MDIRTLTPTLCRLMGTEPPRTGTSEIQEGLVSALEENGIDRIRKCLVYAPDAIGRTIHETHPDYFTGLNEIVCHSEFLDSVEPTWTPVCFASMFSGASPDIHGITRYEKPVLTVDTVFDSMAGSEKSAAIVAVENSSIDLIFRNRDIDYFSERYDAEVIDRTLSLLKENRHDFFVVYNQEYDDLLHRTAPYSPECMEALEHHNRSFITLYEEVRQVWKEYDWLMVYAPDHGAHFDTEKQAGSHGLNTPEDMLLVHHYVFPRRA